MLPCAVHARIVARLMIPRVSDSKHLTVLHEDGGRRGFAPDGRR